MLVGAELTMAGTQQGSSLLVPNVPCDMRTTSVAITIILFAVIGLENVPYLPTQTCLIE